MTEYELVDVIATLSNNMMQAQALFITIFSAYMVVAYTAGKQLSKFQVVFVTFAFLLFSSLMTFGAVQNLDLVWNYADKLYVLNHEEATEIRRNFNIALFYAIRVLLVTGAIAFMWQIRRPKTE
jgi:hypothetical protein